MKTLLYSLLCILALAAFVIFKHPDNLSLTVLCVILFVCAVISFSLAFGVAGLPQEADIDAEIDKSAKELFPGKELTPKDRDRVKAMILDKILRKL